MTTETIRVLLADDHPLVRAGIRATLAKHEGIILVGEAIDGHEAQRLSRHLKPDVLLLDLNMPGPQPTETVIHLRHHSPETKVLALTAYDDDAYVQGLVTVGITGYILKDEAPETLIRAISAVLQGDTWLSRSIVNKLGQPEMTRSEDSKPLLTKQEENIFRMIVKGWDNTRIAIELYLANQTIRNYSSRIYKKLGVSSRAEAIVWAKRHNLFEE